MELLVPFMPFFGALPIAVAAVLIARMWHGRRDGRNLGDLEAQNEQMREELEGLRRELREAQERLDFTERVLTQQRRAGQLPEGEGQR